MLTELSMVKNLPISRQFNLVEAIDVPEIDYETINNTPVPSKVLYLSGFWVDRNGLDYLSSYQCQESV